MSTHVRCSAHLVFALCLTVFFGFASLTLAQDAARPTVQTPPVLLQMVRDDAVHQDLRLKPDQITKVVAALKTVDPRWFRSRNMSTPLRNAEIAKLTTQLQSQLQTILDAPQLIRLTELQRQALGTRMLVRDDVAQALGLSSDKRKQFMDAFLETDKKVADLNEQLRKGEIKNDELQAETNKLKAAERNLFSDRLTVQQRTKIGPLTGRSFDFSKIKRTYPLAPEITEDGVQWIQGGPIKLDDLHGKVVAVHYYAYQCINCQRNLPHYKAWHKDYADKGLVVIGIQTPETSSERSFEKVKSAAKAAGIEYPVFLDSKSSNWKTWSNTMWPTVYLIDKKGFLRRWWQGEMNWQGNPGEKDMRRTVEQLLAE